MKFEVVQKIEIDIEEIAQSIYDEIPVFICDSVYIDLDEFEGLQGKAMKEVKKELLKILQDELKEQG